MFGKNKTNRKLSTIDDIEELMDDLQDKLNNGDMTFEAVKDELITRVDDDIYFVEDNSGKIIKLSIVGDRFAHTYMAVGIITNDRQLVSQRIEGIKLSDFDIEKDDISKIEGRKIGLLKVSNVYIAKVY